MCSTGNRRRGDSRHEWWFAAAVGCAYVLGHLYSCCAAEENGDELTYETTSYEVANWRLLLFTFPEGRRVKHVRIELYERKACSWGEGVVGDARVVIESGDSKVTKALTFGLDTPLRVAFPDGPGGQGPGGYKIGKMIVTTTKDVFPVAITTGGFALGDEWEIQKVFFSWAVAKQIDDLLFARTGRRLPRDLFRHLSGESRIDAQKEAYERILKENDRERKGDKSNY